MQVGVRELRNALSRYLHRVRGGQTIVITDRGEPVARLIPAGRPEPLARLMAEGRVTWSGTAFQPPGKPIRPRPGPPFSHYVSEDRS